MHHILSFFPNEVFSSGFCVVEVEDGEGGLGDFGDGVGAKCYFL